jgi:phage repressor protein C with HTH and peptisase S24 domain
MARATIDADNRSASIPSAGAEKAAFVGRLQTILAHWPSADRLARAMGVSPSAFRKWLKGEAEPSRERLVALARATGVGVAWLADGDGPAPRFESVGGGRRRPGSREASTGDGWDRFVLPPNGPDAPGPLALRQDWIRASLGVEPEHLILEIASGEAMAPTIRDGGTLLVDTADRVVRSSGIYVLEIDGHRLVKRVQRKHDGGLVLISDHPAYHPDVVEKSAVETLVVVGRVVWSGGAV